MAASRIALRYLRTRRIALVCVFSVTMGVMALIVVTSLMDGVMRFYRDSVRGTMADMWVMETDPQPGPQNRQFAHVREKLNPLMEDRGGPIEALAPRQLGAAIVVRGATIGSRDEEAHEGIRVLGIDFALESALVPLRRMLADVPDVRLAVPPGRRDDPLAPDADGRPAILLGDKLARRLGVARVRGPGTPDRVTVFSVDLQRRNGRLEAPHRKVVCRVAGCFTTGRDDYDGFLAYMDRRALRRLKFADWQVRPDASRIYLRFRDGEDLRAAARKVREFAPSLSGQTWEEDNQNMLTALEDQKRILLFILAFIAVVACAAIFGLTWMLVVEKTRDIGILRSMGMSLPRVAAMFAAYGLLLAGAGSVLGLLLGLQVTAHLDAVIGALGHWFGVQLLNPEIYRFRSVPTYVDPASIARILLGVLGGALLASLLASMRTAFMTPLACLRQE